MSPRIVIDTNVYVSRALRIGSVPGQAVDKAWMETTPLLSAATWAEIQAVLRRAKFAPYIQPGTLEPYLDRLQSIATFVAIPFPIRACRDPRDDKFLEVAVYGHADLIVTGDADLLALDPFQGIDILTPADYLKRQ
jgi:putative PIN family toxin of toxin-antitoxin system